MIIISVLLVVALAYLISPTSEPRFPSDEPDELHLNGINLKAVLRIPKTEYRVGERIYVEPRIINIGEHSITIMHADPLFFIEVYDVTDKRILTYPEVKLLVLIIHELKPDEPYFHYEYGMSKLASGYEFALYREGTYLVRAYAEFGIKDPREEIRLYTKSVRIRVVGG